MKKYFLLLNLLLVLFMISCGKAIKESTPSDGMIVNELSKREMKTDLKLLKEQLTTHHINYTHSISKEQFEKAYDELYDKLGDLTNTEFAFEILKLYSLINDNATNATLDSNRYVNRYYLPFEVDLFEEGYIIYQTEKSYSKYLGYTLVAIEGKNTLEVIDTLKDYFGADTTERSKFLALKNINFLDLLKHCKIANSDEVKVTLSKDGNTETVTFKAYKNSDYSKYEFVTNAVDLPSKNNNKYYSYKLLDNSIYIQINRCNEDSEYKIKDFVSQITSLAKPAAFKSIIVDLRNNAGGIQEAMFPLISALQKYSQEGGKLYTLIGPNTCGVSVVNVFAAYSTMSVVVGQATGGLNNYYGYSAKYTLPKSRITLNIPTVNYNYYEGDKVSVFKPNIEKLQSYADFVNGDDTLINLCKSYTK